MIVNMRPRLTVVERVRCVRRQLERIRGMMIAPLAENIMKCPELLADAVKQMPSIEEVESSDVENQELAVELRAVRGELRVISALIEQGAHFSREWARAIGIGVNGYGYDGSARAYAPGARMRVIG